MNYLKVWSFRSDIVLLKSELILFQKKKKKSELAKINNFAFCNWKLPSDVDLLMGTLINCEIMKIWTVSYK